MDIARDMMQNLQEMLAEKSRQARKEATTTFMNLKMKPDQSIKDHMIKVIRHLNEVEINGVKIDKETQVDMILNSLTKMFDQFQLDYKLN